MFSYSTIANPMSQYSFKFKSLREPNHITYFMFTNRTEEEHFPEYTAVTVNRQKSSLNSGKGSLFLSLEIIHYTCKSLLAKA